MMVSFESKLSSRAGELPKKFRPWVQTRHMGLKNVPKKFGTPGPNLAPNLFGLFVQGHITKAGTPNSTVCIELNPKRLGAKFRPRVPNFLGTFFRPICQVWTPPPGKIFFSNSPALLHSLENLLRYSIGEDINIQLLLKKIGLDQTQRKCVTKLKADISSEVAYKQ